MEVKTLAQLGYTLTARDEYGERWERETTSRRVLKVLVNCDGTIQYGFAGVWAELPLPVEEAMAAAIRYHEVLKVRNEPCML